MTGKDIYALGKNSPEVRAKVPLNFVHTPPRLTFDGNNWHAEFWYFMQKFDGKTIMISAPRLRLIFDLSTKQLIKFEPVENAANNSLSEAPELTAKEFYTALNNYLNFCNDITDKIPDAQILTQAEALWKKTLPKSFTESNLSHTKLKTPAQAANISETKDSMLEQYQWEMSQAIANGNQAEYDRAKQKYNELKLGGYENV